MQELGPESPVTTGEEEEEVDTQPNPKPRTSSSDHPAGRHRNWGGRRPGAGAPKGNLNAYRHGRYSTQQKTLARFLSEVPELRDSLARIGARNRAKNKQVETGASLLLEEILKRIGEALVNPDDHVEHNQELIEKVARLQSLMAEKTEKAKNAIKNQPCQTRSKATLYGRAGKSRRSASRGAAR